MRLCLLTTVLSRNERPLSELTPIFLNTIHKRGASTRPGPAHQELGSFLLLSGSDDPIPFGKGTPYEDFSSFSDVQIFSESIAFTGDLLSQHGIVISCKESQNINTTSVAGADEVNDVTVAQPGGNGGFINFYVQRLEWLSRGVKIHFIRG